MNKGILQLDLQFNIVVQRNPARKKKRLISDKANTFEIDSSNISKKLGQVYHDVASPLNTTL